jgi:hypothetical protein
VVAVAVLLSVLSFGADGKPLVWLVISHVSVESFHKDVADAATKIITARLRNAGVRFDPSAPVPIRCVVTAVRAPDGGWSEVVAWTKLPTLRIGFPVFIGVADLGFFSRPTLENFLDAAAVKIVDQLAASSAVGSFEEMLPPQRPQFHPHPLWHHRRFRQKIQTQDRHFFRSGGFLLQFLQTPHLVEDFLNFSITSFTSPAFSVFMSRARSSFAPRNPDA